MALFGLDRVRASLGRRGTAATGSGARAQIEDDGAGGRDGKPDVRTSVATLVDGIEDAADGTFRAFVAAGAAASCPHGRDSSIVGSVSWPSDGPGSASRITDIVASTGTGVPATTSRETGPGVDGQGRHAVARAFIQYDFDGRRWRPTPAIDSLPPGVMGPGRYVLASADEVETGTARAAAVAAFSEAGQIVKRFEKTDEGTARGVPDSGAGGDGQEPETSVGEGRAAGTAAGDGTSPPVEYTGGAIEVDPSNLTFDNHDLDLIVMDDVVGVVTGGERWWSGIDVPVDPYVSLRPPPVTIERADADDAVTIHVDLSLLGGSPGSPTEFDFAADGDEVVLTIDAPDSAFHLEIAPPGEPLPDPPSELPTPLQEHLRGHAAAADESSLTIQYAFERPFDDIVTEYLSAPGTEDYERFQSLSPGESMELDAEIQVGSRVDNAAATDGAALTWTDIEAGTALVNDNVGSLPLGSFAFGGKTIEFTPTPAGDLDSPIVVHTGADGRIDPSRTLRGTPSDRSPDYQVSMPRSDAHAILRAPNQAEVAGAVWEAGRVSVRPHGFMNRLTFGLATTAIAISRFLGV